MKGYKQNKTNNKKQTIEKMLFRQLNESAND